MYKENGFTYRFLVIAVIILIALAGVFVNKIIGKNGVVETVTNVETSFNKEDVLDKINYMITQHFVKINAQAKENNQVISEIYSNEIVIEYLKQNSIIEEMYSENDELISDNYKINMEKLYEDSEKTHFNSGEYFIIKQENMYNVIYRCDGIEDEVIGELQIQQV